MARGRVDLRVIDDLGVIVDSSIIVDSQLMGDFMVEGLSNKWLLSNIGRQQRASL